MAVCQIVENPELGPEKAEEVMGYVRRSGPVPPEGARLVLAGPANPGWRVISVWDSRADIERFVAERLAPAYAEAGLSIEDNKRTIFEVHNLVAGDLMGAAQAA